MKKPKFKRIVVPVGSIWPQPKRSPRQRYRYSRDVNGQRKTMICSTDMETTLAMVMRVIKQEEERRTGLVSPDTHRHAEEDRRTIAEHLADWKRSMEDAGLTKHHVRNFHASATAILLGTPPIDPKATRARGRARAVSLPPTGWRRISQIVPSKVGGQVAQVKRATSASSANRYLDATNAFLSWGVGDGRWIRNPCDRLERFKASADRRRVRRVLPPAQFAALIDATDRGPERCKLSGKQRSLIYRTVCACGLRANEARRLPMRDAVLEGPNPGLWADGSISKNRKRQFVPLPLALAAELRAATEGRGPDEPLLRLAQTGNTARLVKADLEAAGIPYETADGYFDFHGLRHECGALLISAGVNIKAVQQHMRHSSIQLTLDTYGHLMPDDREHARRSLRSFGVDERKKLSDQESSKNRALRNAQRQPASKCRQMSSNVRTAPLKKGRKMRNSAENAVSSQWSDGESNPDLLNAIQPSTEHNPPVHQKLQLTSSQPKAQSAAPTQAHPPAASRRYVRANGRVRPRVPRKLLNTRVSDAHRQFMRGLIDAAGRHPEPPPSDA